MLKLEVMLEPELELVITDWELEFIMELLTTDAELEFVEVLDTVEFVDESEEPELVIPVIELLIEELLELVTEFFVAELTAVETFVDDKVIDDNDELLELAELDMDTFTPDDEAEIEDDKVENVLDVVMELVVVLDGL